MTSISRRRVAKTLSLAAGAVLMLRSATAQEVKRAKLGHSFTDSHPLQIFDVPFVFGSDAEAAYVLDGPVGRKTTAWAT